MTATKVTDGATEADLEARIDAALAIAFPWLPANAFEHQLTFRFDLEHKTIRLR